MQTTNGIDRQSYTFDISPAWLELPSNFLLKLRHVFVHFIIVLSLVNVCGQKGPAKEVFDVVFLDLRYRRAKKPLFDIGLVVLDVVLTEIKKIVPLLLGKKVRMQSWTLEMIFLVDVSQEIERCLYSRPIANQLRDAT